MTETTYLDHNATTPIRTRAVDAVTAALGVVGNPSSVHRDGRAARALIEDARERIAALFGAEPASVIFTSGGTEANGMALGGNPERRVIVSDIEHASVLAARPDAERVPVDGEGVVDLDALETMLAEDGRRTLVSVMLANNETGVVQPVAAVAETARRFGARVHCDAVQAAGKIAVNVGSLGVDAVSLSAHKLGGPKGIGALIVAGDDAPATMLRGGGQERGRRAGTENVPGIAGFAAAAEDAVSELADFAALAALRDGLEAAVLRNVPGARVFGSGADCLANTSCFASPGIAADTQVMALDLAGYAVSAGAACSSGKVAPSHVLAAMGARDSAATAIRVSLGRTNTAQNIDDFVTAWTTLHRDRKRNEPARMVA